MSRNAAFETSVTGLKRVRLLEGVPDSALETLARQCRWRRYVAEERIISREAPDSDVYLIVGGRVRITAFSGGGRQVTYADMSAGQWFGDFAAIDGASRSADVVALEETLLAALTPDIFLRLLREHPVVNECMLRRLVTCVRELTDRVYDLTTLGVQNRVHAEILRLAKEAGVANNTARIDPAPKHTDLAAHISTYREQVTREITAMAKQGLVERSGSALVVPDIERLERIVAEVRRSL
jgi:CRP/FNR family cyclic AMP-dependent transcriptional regulator